MTFMHIIKNIFFTVFSLNQVNNTELQLTNTDGRLIPHPESRIDRLSEGGFKLVNKWHGFCYTVERQCACIIVQENTNARRVGCIDLDLIFHVASWVAGIRAEKAPGPAVVANAGWITVTCSLDSLVGDANGYPLTAPIHLPVVGATRQGLFA